MNLTILKKNITSSFFVINGKSLSFDYF